jgi:hypothetical protein
MSMETYVLEELKQKVALKYQKMAGQVICL